MKNTELKYKFNVDDVLAEGRVNKKDIDLIKDWSTNLKEKTFPTLTDQQIVVFLLSCANDIDLTKNTIQRYYEIKQSAPYLFNDVDIDSDKSQLVFNTTAYCPIYWRSKHTVIMYCKIIDDDLKKVFFDDHCRIGMMIIESTTFEDPPTELIVVLDVEKVSLMHLTKIKLNSLKTFFSFIQEGLPVRLSAVHYINSNYALKKFFVIAKMFIAPELYSKIHFHTGTDALLEIFPKDFIPNEYGGELAPTEEYRKDTIKRLRDMKEFWEAEVAIRNNLANEQND